MKKSRVRGFLLVACAVCFASYAEESALRKPLPNPIFSGVATSVLLETAKEALKDNMPETLIPYLREITLRLENDSLRRATRTFCMYQIGVAEMQLERYCEAEEDFALFLKEYPESSFVSKATLQMTEACARLEEWREVERTIQPALANETLKSEDVLPAQKLLSEALFVQEKWEEAVPVLSSVYAAAEKEKPRKRAAVRLAICYAKLDDFENFLVFLPLGGELAQKNTELNLSVIEFADMKAGKGDFKTALFLCRKVLLRSEIVALFEGEIRACELFLAQPFVPRVGRTRSAYDKAHALRQMDLENYVDRLARAQEADSYDMDVLLRIAQSFVGLKRDIPAYMLYHRMIEENPEDELIEDARYGAFSVMLNQRDWDAVVEEGAAYIAEYRVGNFFEEVSLNLMQVYLKQHRNPDARALGLMVLNEAPDHRFMDQIKYLMGYIYFQDSDYQEAWESFSAVVAKWPRSIRLEACDYWASMSLLFRGDYASAASGFDAYLNNSKYAVKMFAEDATYRLGVARYGLGEFAESEAILLDFVRVYPESELLSEAYSMLGDLRGAEGDLDVALGYYLKAYEKAGRIEQADYAVFQSAVVYELEERYEETIVWVEKYLKEWGEQCNIAESKLWIGRSLKALGNYTEALSTYLDALVQVGNDIENVEVDSVLNELVDEYESEDSVPYWADLQKQLKQELHRANQEGKAVLVLRLETLFAYTTEGAKREEHVRWILTEASVNSASPLTLRLMAREAFSRGKYQRVYETAERCKTRFETSSLLLDLMSYELQSRFAEKEYRQVLVLAEEVAERFGYPKEVGLLQKLKADAYRLLKRYPEALQTYTEIVSVRIWRGPLVPEVLYRIGQCHRDQGNEKKAFAFFQRVYVLYGGATEWAAKAYEASIRSMKTLGNHDADILRPYQEMLANEKIAATPEGKRARVALDRLQAEGVRP